MGRVDSFADDTVFYCERHHCTLRVAVCIARQKTGRFGLISNYVRFKDCAGCDQGARNKAAFLKGRTMQPNPEKGKGDREQNCAHYDQCLSVAAINEWPSFHCEECEFALIGGVSPKDLAEMNGGSEPEPEPEEIELPESAGPTAGNGDDSPDCAHYDECFQYAESQGWESFHCEHCELFKAVGNEEPSSKRFCVECNVKETISPKHSLCASCLAKRGNKAMREKQKNGNQSTSKKKRARADRGGVDSPEVVSVDFERYPEILSQVEILADEEMRPVDMQILYMLKLALTASENANG